MTIVPQCCDARYEAVDELVTEMRDQEADGQPAESSGLGTTLLVKVWDFLKGEKHADVETVVQRHLSIKPSTDTCCHLGEDSDSKTIDDTRQDLKQMMEDLWGETSKITKKPSSTIRCDPNKCASAQSLRSQASRGQRRRGRGCGRGRARSRPTVKPHDCLTPRRPEPCCGPAPPPPRRRPVPCCGAGPPPREPEAAAEPLSCALKSIKTAETFDNKCAWKLHDLLAAEERISNHVQLLEAREMQGIAHLQEADAMWTTMEQQYKARVLEAQARQAVMLAKEKEVQKSLVKWRTQNQQRLSELEALRAATLEKEERAEVKRREAARAAQDSSVVRARMDAVRKEIDTVRGATERFRRDSQNNKMDLEKEIKSLEKQIAEEKKRRASVVESGRGAAAGARDNLATACRVLLQLRLEIEEHNTEEETINLEIEVMKESMGSCEDKCNARIQLIRQELADVEAQIARHKLRCVQCHRGSSTSDFARICSDCPRCAREIECTFQDRTHCCTDASATCPCHVVKAIFIENVLENMYNALEAAVKKNDELAGDVLDCLNRSTNGKLSGAVRDKLHAYVMSTVKQNLDMCVMGGAMKTRCEIDPETREALALCLDEVMGGAPTKDGDPKDKTVCRSGGGSAPCARWRGAAACGCPGGPDDCECRKAPAPPADPQSCGQKHVTTQMSKSSATALGHEPSVRGGSSSNVSGGGGGSGGPSGGSGGGGGSGRSSGGGGKSGGGKGGRNTCACHPPGYTADLCRCASMHSGVGRGSGKKVSQTNSGTTKRKGSVNSTQSSRNKPSSRDPSVLSRSSESMFHKDCLLSKSEISLRSSRGSNKKVHYDSDHNYLCHLLSRINQSLHSYFHPPPSQPSNSKLRGEASTQKNKAPLSPKGKPPLYTKDASSSATSKSRLLKNADATVMKMEFLSTAAVGPPSKLVFPLPFGASTPLPSAAVKPLAATLQIGPPSSATKDEPTRVEKVPRKQIILDLPPIKDRPAVTKTPEREESSENSSKTEPVIGISKGSDYIAPSRRASLPALLSHDTQSDASQRTQFTVSGTMIELEGSSQKGTSTNFLADLMCRLVRSVQSIFQGETKFGSQPDDIIAPSTHTETNVNVNTVMESPILDERLPPKDGIENVRESSMRKNLSAEELPIEELPRIPIVSQQEGSLSQNSDRSKRDSPSLKPVIELYSRQESNVSKPYRQHSDFSRFVSLRKLDGLTSNEIMDACIAEPKSSNKCSRVSFKSNSFLSEEEFDRVNQNEIEIETKNLSAKSVTSEIEDADKTAQATAFQATKLGRKENPSKCVNVSTSFIEKTSGHQRLDIKENLENPTDGVCARVCKDDSEETISDAKTITVIMDSAKSFPNESKVYCDPTDCTGPCSKKRKKTAIIDLNKVSTADPFRTPPKSLKKSCNQLCKACVRKERKVNCRRNAKLAGINQQQLNKKKLIPEIYVPIEKPKFCKNASEIAKESSFYGYGEQLRDEVDRLNCALGGGGHRVNIDVPPAVYSYPKKKTCRHAGVRKTKLNLECPRITEPIELDMEPHLPDFLKNFQLPRARRSLSPRNN